jgi:putative acetyltransferase
VSALTVRPARSEDVAALAAVAEVSYASGFAGILEPEVLASRDAATFAARFAESLDRLVLAEDGHGRALGFALVTAGHLDMLFVDPAAQSGGVGSRLLAHVEAQGARTLECFRDNTAARRFYERHGWRLERSYEREFAGRTRAFVAYAKP